MKTYSLFLIIFIFSFIFPLQAGSADLKQRFIQRKSQINSLLIAGKVGENNKGFLEVKGSLTDAENKIVNAENNDRKKVYQTIAKKNGTSPDQVGVIRADNIRKGLMSGALYQDKSGKWVKK